jgi:predicted acyl esterase
VTLDIRPRAPSPFRSAGPALRPPSTEGHLVGIFRDVPSQLIKVAVSAAAFALVTGGPALAGTGTTTTGDALTTYSKASALHFTATGLGPNGQSCDIVYDLYVPDDASADHPVPAILTTNGFGGSKDDQASVADLFAKHDYEVLSYSGLGFGGSGCNIELDSPEWDGKAASELVTLLAARPEVAKDAPGDPVIGTWGGSYGGGFQFALAAVDPRIDAMIPQITWNDLSYSLGPNNGPDSLSGGATPPGAMKYEWTELFTGLGIAQPAENPGTSGNPPTGCPGYDRQICQAQAESTALGYAPPDVVALLQHASAEYELFKNADAHVPPMMLMQGQNDTLFNINEAVANYEAAKRRGAPVKLVLKEAGHSGGAAAGEVDDSDPAKGYLDQLYLNWYDHYLKHEPVDTGPEVEWFRDWATYDTHGSAQPAYASAPQWPVGPAQQLFLSGGSNGNGGDLVGDAGKVATGSQTVLNPPGGETGSYSETSAVGPVTGPTDVPGTFASWTTAPLTTDTDVVGIPKVTVSISAPQASNLDPTTEVVLYAKLYDVAPDGTKTMVHGLVAPSRIADLSKPVTLSLPGEVHRYGAGHQIELVLSTTDSAYIGSRVPGPITISTDKTNPSVLSLPLAPAGPTPVLPEAPYTAATVVVGALAVGVVAVVRRRRTVVVR